MPSKKNGGDTVTKQKSFLRDVLGEHMRELGQKNSRVVVVNADLMGTCRNKSFVDKFPSRSFNTGIAEQNLISFAAGLAHEGFIPYAFSMAPFISMRACEQCRTDVAYAKLNVRMVATYAGCSGGISGATHWAVEDCAIMTAIPGITVLEPCDAIQAAKMLDATLEYNGPVYIRSGVEAVTNIYDASYEYRIGKATIAKDGDDGAIIASGVVIQYALEASDSIEQKTGKRVRVIDMHTIKPIDREAVISAAETGNVIVAQDHNVIGGLGYAAAAVIAQAGIAVHLKILGVNDKFVSMAHAQFLYHEFGYDSCGIEKTMCAMLSEVE